MIKVKLNYKKQLNVLTKQQTKEVYNLNEINWKEILLYVNFVFTKFSAGKSKSFIVEGVENTGQAIGTGLKSTKDVTVKAFDSAAQGASNLLGQLNFKNKNKKSKKK